MAFTGTGKIWMNGSLVEWADAKIHIASHVIHYGSGVFEGARCYDTPRGSACFRLDAHMRRLFDSARIYRMEPQVDQATLTEAVLDTIRANKHKACYIRPIIYRGYNALGVNPFPCPVDTAMLTWEWGAYLGQDALENGVDVRDQLVVALGAEHVPDAGEDLGQLRQLAADQDGGGHRGLQRRDRARYVRLPQRRQRPEPVRRPRRT